VSVDANGSGDPASLADAADGNAGNEPLRRDASFLEQEVRDVDVAVATVRAIGHVAVARELDLAARAAQTHRPRFANVCTVPFQRVDGRRSARALASRRPGSMR
jgi:hypothetical protein